MVPMKTTAETAKKDINDFMETHGKTLEKISEKTGVAISTLIAVRKGNVKPQSNTIYKLNKYLSLFD